MTLPVQTADNGTRFASVTSSNYTAVMQQHPYSFGIWFLYDITAVRMHTHTLSPPSAASLAHIHMCVKKKKWLAVEQSKTIYPAAMINTAGVTVTANTTSLKSALQDYPTSGQSGFDSLILGILSSSHHHKNMILC